MFRVCLKGFVSTTGLFRYSSESWNLRTVFASACALVRLLSTYHIVLVIQVIENTDENHPPPYRISVGISTQRCAVSGGLTSYRGLFVNCLDDTISYRRCLVITFSGKTMRIKRASCPYCYRLSSSPVKYFFVHPVRTLLGPELYIFMKTKKWTACGGYIYIDYCYLHCPYIVPCGVDVGKRLTRRRGIKRSWYTYLL